MKAVSTIRKEIKALRDRIDDKETPPDEARLAYIVECALYWVLGDPYRPSKEVSGQIWHLREEVKSYEKEVSGQIWHLREEVKSYEKD